MLSTRSSVFLHQLTMKGFLTEMPTGHPDLDNSPHDPLSVTLNSVKLIIKADDPYYGANPISGLAPVCLPFERC